MLTEQHKEIAGKIWEIANRLRGPYRPPQYRLVMLPMDVLRRLDCVFEPTKDAEVKGCGSPTASGMALKAIARLLTKIVDPHLNQRRYYFSPFTFQKLLGASESIAREGYERIRDDRATNPNGRSV